VVAAATRETALFLPISSRQSSGRRRGGGSVLRGGWRAAWLGSGGGWRWQGASGLGEEVRGVGAHTVTDSASARFEASRCLPAACADSLFARLFPSHAAHKRPMPPPASLQERVAARVVVPATSHRRLAPPRAVPASSRRLLVPSAPSCLCLAGLGGRTRGSRASAVPDAYAGRSARSPPARTPTSPVLPPGRVTVAVACASHRQRRLRAPAPGRRPRLRARGLGGEISMGSSP
jgi:hypothetical protein